MANNNTIKVTMQIIPERKMEAGAEAKRDHANPNWLKRKKTAKRLTSRIEVSSLCLSEKQL